MKRPPVIARVTIDLHRQSHVIPQDGAAMATDRAPAFPLRAEGGLFPASSLPPSSSIERPQQNQRFKGRIRIDPTVAREFISQPGRALWRLVEQSRHSPGARASTFQRTAGQIFWPALGRRRWCIKIVGRLRLGQADTRQGARTEEGAWPPAKTRPIPSDPAI